MDESGFEFSAEDHDGYRLIRTVLPAVVTTQALSVEIARYLTLWETDLPIVVVNDGTRLLELDAQVGDVLLAIFKRNASEPRFRGSTWFTGGNARLDAQLRDLLVQAGRDPESIVETEAEALAYVERCLRD